MSGINTVEIIKTVSKNAGLYKNLLKIYINNSIWHK